MQENTNKSIFVNSIILYVRLFITAVAGLFTTRFALLALGANDFGLFSVVGSVISFIAIINTIMLSTSNRFIATTIGKGNVVKINEIFNVDLVIHILIAIITLAIAYPLGNWYILTYINYDGNIDSVLTVYHVTIIGSVASFVGVLEEIPTSFVSSGRTIEIADLSSPKYLFATRFTSEGVTFFMFSR